MPHGNGGNDDDDGVHECDDVHVFVQLLSLHLYQLYVLFRSIQRLVALQGRGSFHVVCVSCGSEVQK